MGIEADGEKGAFNAGRAIGAAVASGGKKVGQAVRHAAVKVPSVGGVAVPRVSLSHDVHTSLARRSNNILRGKSMEYDEVEDTGGGNPADVALDDSGGDQPPMTHEEGGEEVFGAQVLRRLHKDAILLMQEYDEMKGMLENEGIKIKLQTKLEALEEDLTEIEELWEANYNNEEMKLPPLEGSDKSLEEDDVESQDEIPTEEADETSDEDSINEKDSEPTDSQEEEEPTEEEAVGAMGSKSYVGKVGSKARRGAITGSYLGGPAGAAIGAGKGRRLGAAVGSAAGGAAGGTAGMAAGAGVGAGVGAAVAGKHGAKIGAAIGGTVGGIAGGAAGGHVGTSRGYAHADAKRKAGKSMHDPETKPGFEENQVVDHPKGRRSLGVNSEKAFSELDEANDEKVQDAAHMGISFQDHHKKNMTGAHGWLSEIGNTATPDWQEEHRMKSYAWHKSMDSILDDFGYESKSLGGAIGGAIAGLAGPVGGAIHGAMASSLDAAVEGKKGMGNVSNMLKNTSPAYALASSDDKKELEADGHKGVISQVAGQLPGVHRIAAAVKKGSHVARAAGGHVARNAGKYAAGAGGVAVGGAAGYGAGRRGKDIDASGNAQDPKTVPGYEEDQVEDHRVTEFEEGENPHMNSIANASAHLHELSQTRDFGDEHRSKALACAKDLESAMSEDSDKESQEDIPDEEDQAFEPGEMGEKSLKLKGQELSKKHKQQNRNISELNNRMLDLLQRL